MLLAIISFLLALFVVPSTAQIQFRIFILIIVCFLFVSSVFLYSAYWLFKRQLRSRPNVTNVVPTGLYPESATILLLEPSPIFSYDTIVSIYYAGEMEELRAIGRVIIIQEDERIQVLLLFSVRPQDTIENMRSELHNIKQHLIVKPTVPSVALRLLKEFDNNEP